MTQWPLDLHLPPIRHCKKNYHRSCMGISAGRASYIFSLPFSLPVQVGYGLSVKSQAGSGRPKRLIRKPLRPTNKWLF
jgi:hypothetical protein